MSWDCTYVQQVTHQHHGQLLSQRDTYSIRTTRATDSDKIISEGPTQAHVSSFFHSSMRAQFWVHLRAGPTTRISPGRSKCNFKRKFQQHVFQTTTRKQQQMSHNTSVALKQQPLSHTDEQLHTLTSSMMFGDGVGWGFSRVIHFLTWNMTLYCSS